MDYSLWRGTEKLGRIRLSLGDEYDDPEKVHGMLELTATDTAIESVWQVRFSPGGDPGVVFEHPLPGLNSPAPSNGNQVRAFSSDGPRVLSPKEAAGIPADRVLVLRDHDGAVIATDMIPVNRLPDDFVRNRSWLAQCAAAGVVMSPWSVFASRSSGLGEG